MIPAALAAIWYGSWVFTVAIGALGGLMHWEWQGFCGAGTAGKRGVSWAVGIAGCTVGPLLVPVLGGGEAVLAGISLFVLFTLLAIAGRRTHLAFLSAGSAYILAACMSMVWIRFLPESAMETVLWLMLVITATDTGAYFAGRSIGGPRLAPKISPKKTWAGLIGGLAAAALVGTALMVVLDRDGVMAVALASAVLAVVAQAGDLLVSKAKRSFGVKDSSELIPGHGGVLDRFDGYLTVVPLVAVASWIAGSPLSWL